MTRTLVIGCGAAGAAAAVAAAERGERVTVLERNRKPLKKLGVTGNGRGNLLNACPPEDYPRRYFGDTAFACRVLEAVPFQALWGFWEGLGVPLALEDEGRVYPAAYLASVAADALLLRLKGLQADILCNVKVNALAKTENGFVAEATESVYADGHGKAGGKQKPGELLAERPRAFQADRVIVAAGGQAAPAHGTDGSAYGLLMGFGHALTPLRPALCALRTDPAPLRGLDGQRVRAALSLYDLRGAFQRQSRGEVLFAKDGISGIAAMELARFVREGWELRLDLRQAIFGNRAGEPCPGARPAATAGGLPEADALMLFNRRMELCASRALSELFTGAATPALAVALLRAAGLEGAASRPVALLTQQERAALARAIAGFPLRALGTRGFEAAQVTAGGIDPAAFDPATLQSALVPGLYAAGEALDVDGDCGGFNLMFAIASGILAGRGASRCS